MDDFEFDDRKSAANLTKHGIDFVAAQALWLDSNLVEVQAKSDDETRFLVIARLANKHWSAIITHRGESNQNKVIRIISVRRARKTEVKLYES